MKTILIVKTSSIGDLLHCFPVLVYLKGKFPDAKIDWLAEKRVSSLVHSHPLVDEVIEIDTKAWKKAPFASLPEIKKSLSSIRKTRYDLVLDLQGNAKSGFFTWIAKSKKKVGFGWREVSELPNLLVTNQKVTPAPDLPVADRYLSIAKGALGDVSPTTLNNRVDFPLTEPEKEQLAAILGAPSTSSPRLMICFGSHWKNKRLPFEALVQFLENIREISPSFLFCGGSAAELEEARRLTDHFAPRSLFIGRLSFPLWQQVMANIEGVIGMDSGSLYLAATTKTPCFALFGPSASAVYAPRGKQFGAFQASCPYGTKFVRQCPKMRTCPTGACVRTLDPKVLADAFLRFWSTREQVQDNLFCLEEDQGALV